MTCDSGEAPPHMVSIKMFVRIIIRFPLLLSVLCVCFLERRYDRDGLPEGYLQHRIDDALAQWRSSPFARELDFAGFCEYLLPYRIGTEEPEEWWTDYRVTFGGVLDTLASMRRCN